MTATRTCEKTNQRPSFTPQSGEQTGQTRSFAGTEGARADRVPGLVARDLTCGYDGAAVLEHVDFALCGGEVLALLGPNGVGKTTLFKTLLGFLPPLAGSVEVCGRGVDAWNRRDLAARVAYIPQAHVPSFSFSVRDVVLMGRTPRLSGFSMPDASDERAADEAIDRLGLGHLAERDYTLLSGGERQMVLIARALAQQPLVLVMDEPCASLDLGNQARLLGQVARLAREGLAVVMTTHDPNHALMLESRVLCLGRGGVVASGAARDVLDARTMSELYGTRVAVGDVEAFDGVRTTACAPVIDDGVTEGTRA